MRLGTHARQVVMNPSGGRRSGPPAANPHYRSSLAPRCSCPVQQRAAAEDPMPWDARSTIERLIEAVEEKKRTNKDDKLHRLLWKEEGFRERRLVDEISFRRHSQSIFVFFQASNYNHTAVHYLVRRRFETAEEVDEWLSYFFLEKNQSVRDPHPGEVVYSLCRDELARTVRVCI